MKIFKPIAALLISSFVKQHKIPLHPPFPKGEMLPLFGKEGLGEILKYVFLPINSLVTIFLFLSISHAHAAEIAVIVNASGPLVSAGERDIADIYLGEKRFQDGIKIVPLLYTEGSVKEAFLKETLRMTPKDYKLYWTKKIFQEGTPLPKTPAGIPDIINTVKETEGAIGFLPRDMLRDLSGIKVIKIIK